MALSEPTFTMSTVGALQEAGLNSKHPVGPASLDPPVENLFTARNPFVAKILSVTRIAGSPNTEYEVCHVVIEHDGNVPCWEGMCYLVGAPDTAPEDFAYFLLVTSRYGDQFDGKTASLCVNRAGKVSEYLCDARPGDNVHIAGPNFRNMLLAQNNPFATQIMVATETGIAPFRGFLRRKFTEDVPFKFEGYAWLIFGAKDKSSVLYDEELSKLANEHSRQFTYDKAFNSIEGVHDIIEKNIAKIYNLLNGGAYISFCGLETMMPGIENIFREEATKRGDVWESKHTHFIKTNQWREIVYDYQMPETYIKLK